ncbi:hypothetical protein TWF694_010008 [Orbilia ellipsospora]|uniref:Uncharacterized protein n=1 Tax=Orbilia ellipsospora TaxID=2528407 RepID=A0AAV9X936_9PEZI
MEKSISVGQKAKDLHELPYISGAELLAFVADKRPWRITPIVKCMPQNIWGSYSRDLDPSKSGNHFTGLLDGTGVSIPLVMGFSMRPPEPKISDDKIHKFNIVKDMKKSVSSGAVPQLPQHGVALDTWNPNKSTIEKVKDTWEKGKNDPQDVVNRWTARMKFSGGEKLTGSRPAELLMRYKDMVPAAPAIATSTATA